MHFFLKEVRGDQRVRWSFQCSEIKFFQRPNPGLFSFLKISPGFLSLAVKGLNGYRVKPQSTISLEGGSVKQLTAHTVIRVAEDRIIEKYR